MKATGWKVRSERRKYASLSPGNIMAIMYEEKHFLKMHKKFKFRYIRALQKIYRKKLKQN